MIQTFRNMTVESVALVNPDVVFQYLPYYKKSIQCLLMWQFLNFLLPFDGEEKIEWNTVFLRQ